jgi:mannose-6-phosphate isomerase-like protein (cupin superfamily)
MTPRNLGDVLAGFDQPWSPRTVATVNDYDVRVFKAQGEFTPHRHDDTDELFYVIEGRLTIRMESGDVELGPGDLFVVPRGVQHQPFSEHGASALLLEPSATVNTGDNPGALTAPRVTLDD